MAGFETSFRLTLDDAPLRQGFRRAADEADSSFGRIGQSVRTITAPLRGLTEATRGAFGLLGAGLSGFGLGALASQITSFTDAGVEAARRAREAVEAEWAARSKAADEIARATSELRAFSTVQTEVEKQLERIAAISAGAMANAGKVTQSATGRFEEFGGIKLLSWFPDLLGDNWLTRLIRPERGTWTPGMPMSELNDLAAGIEATTNRGRTLAIRRLSRGAAAADADARAAVMARADALEREKSRETEIAIARARGLKATADLWAEVERHHRVVTDLEGRRGELTEATYNRSLESERELHEATKRRIVDEAAADARAARDREMAREATERSAKARRMDAYEKSLVKEAADPRFTAGALGVVSGLSQRVGLGAAVDGAARQHAESMRSSREQTEAIRRVEQAVREQRGAAGRFS